MIINQKFFLDKVFTNFYFIIQEEKKSFIAIKKNVKMNSQLNLNEKKEGIIFYKKNGEMIK